MSQRRVAFVFKSGRRLRLEETRSGTDAFPHEFFYGFIELRERGMAVDLIEEAELTGGRDGAVARGATRLIHGGTGINAGLTLGFGRKRSLASLNRFDVLVATTNSQGHALALLRACGVLKPRVLFLAMGVLPRDVSRLHRAAARRLLREVAVAPISRAEEAYLRDSLGPEQDLAYLPFGVDHRFWTPGAGEGKYVLSIGNDAGRDYATLAAAWGPEHPPLKIVSKRPVPTSAGPVEVIAGDWNRQVLSDGEVRNLFRGASFVVLPLTDTIQPAGQSACLQAMACGKAVILSDIAGLWDRDLMIDGETCLLVPPGSVRALGRAAEGLAIDPQRARAIGERARAAVEASATVDVMAAALERRLDALMVGEPLR